MNRLKFPTKNQFESYETEDALAKIMKTLIDNDNNYYHEVYHQQRQIAQHCNGISNRCTIIIIILASVSMLLFAALIISIMIIKRNRFYGPKHHQLSRSLSVPSNLSRYSILSNLFCPSCSSTSLQPRKSSLKKPTELFHVNDLLNYDLNNHNSRDENNSNTVNNDELCHKSSPITRSHTFSDLRNFQQQQQSSNGNIHLNIDDANRRKSMVTFNDVKQITLIR